MDAYDAENPYYRPDYARKNPMISPSSPGFLDYTGLGLGAAGTLAGAYGAYEQSQQAQKQYELMVKAWQAEQDRQARMDEDNRAQQQFTNALASAQYGQAVKRNDADDYAKYARAYGI